MGVIIGRNETQHNAIANEQLGLATPLAIVSDVTKDPKRIVNETIEQFDKLYVLLNDAGVVSYNDIVDVKQSEFDRVFGTNVWSEFN